MAIVSSSREATKDEMAREIDRCHTVICKLESEVASLRAAAVLDYENGVKAERERIAKALDDEADATPCAQDAVVVRDCAALVRAGFSYEEVERIQIEAERTAAPTTGGEA